jgi:uncharacterized protein (TIGR02001 family)
MKKTLLAVLLATSGLAQADVTGNFGLTTDYRFRGISQTQNSVAVQGGIDYTHASGFYAGNWNSSISSELYPGSSGIESDLYAGYKKDVWNGLTVDVGSYNYFYPRTNTNTDTYELYAGLSYGLVSTKYSYSLGDYFGVAGTKGTQYFQADLAYPVIEKLTARAHVGRTDVDSVTTLNYTDYNVGVVYDYKGYNVGASYYVNGNYGSDAKSFNTANGQRLYKDSVVVSVVKYF